MKLKKKVPTRLLICDIDGTIADIRGRLQKAGNQPNRKNKRAFQLWLDRLQNDRILLKDRAIAPVLELLPALLKGSPTIAYYLTGRAERYRKVTQRWLNKNKCPRLDLLMRPDGNWQSARAFKQTIIRDLCEKYSTKEVICLDDDGAGDCTAMYAKNGWTLLKVCLP